MNDVIISKGFEHNIVSVFFLFQFPVIIKKNPGLGFSITGGLGLPSLEKRDNVS
jgi:hypothetical protein